MKMSEFILAVGDENIVFQNLLTDAQSVDKTKAGTKITFYTDQVQAEEFLSCSKTKKIGLVVWIPRHKAEIAIAAFNAAGPDALRSGQTNEATNNADHTTARSNEMSTSRETLSGWFDRGVSQGATHLIVVCDTFDWDSYPVFVKTDEDVRKRYDEFEQNNMQKVMEVYALHLPKETQMNEHRSFHFETTADA